jgi:hypothetical protein
MAVAVELTFTGATLEQYDEVIRKMGFHPGGSGGPGALFHWVTKTDDGIRVVDVWETKEQFQSFAQEKIGPLSAEVGFPSQPEIAFSEVHNYLTAES